MRHDERSFAFLYAVEARSSSTCNTFYAYDYRTEDG